MNSSKVLLLVIAVFTALLLVSCNNQTSDRQQDDTVTTAAAEDTTAAEPEEVEKTKEQLVNEKIEALATETYDNDEIRFYVKSLAASANWGSREIYAAEENNEPINDAVYKRNLYIEEKFDIKIAETVSTGTTLTTEARQFMLSGDDSIDVYMLPLSAAATLSQEGLLNDLHNVPNIDLESPWWDKAVEKAFAFGNKMYFTIGDISILDKVASRGIYFNKDMIKSYNLESPYELVANNEWTLEKMYEMSKKVHSDVDNNGVLNELDIYGILYEKLSLPQMYFAIGGSTVELDDESKFEITFMTEKNQTLMTRLMDMLYDTDISYCYNSSVHPRSGTTKLNIRTYFENGRGLFWECGFNNLDFMRSTETDFGIVPVPKYDKDEEFYSSFYTGGPAALCIPTTNTELDKTGRIIESLCAYSSITLMPAYYETCIQGKYTRDSEAVEMLDIIFANRRYDIGYIFTNTNIQTQLINLADKSDTNVASMWARLEDNFIKVIGDISAKYR